MMKSSYSKTLKFSLMAAILALSACTSDRQTSEAERKVAALQIRYPHYNFVIVQSDNSNAMADAVLVGTLRSGVASANARQIGDQLRSPQAPYVAVLGDGDTMAAATLERALADGKDKIPAGRSVMFVGDRKYEPPLKAAAAHAGVTLEFVAFPS